MQENKKLAIVSGGKISKFPLYVYWSEPQENVKPHTHEFVEIVLIFRGQAEHICNGKQNIVKKNDVFVIPRDFNHEYRNASSDFSLVNILFIPESMPIPLLDIPQQHGFNKFFFSNSGEHELYPLRHTEDKLFTLLMELASRLHNEHVNKVPGHLFCSLGIFIELLAYLSRIFSEEKKSSAEKYDYISNAITFLNKHYRESFKISTLCKATGMSRATLQRNFFTATGCSPIQYMLQLRISEAAILLQNSGKSLTEIAAAVGFSDSNYFGRQFKKIHGISPGAFRKKRESVEKRFSYHSETKPI